MDTSSLSRRGFLGGIGAGAAAVAVLGSPPPAGAGTPPTLVDSYPADVVPHWISATYDAVLAQMLTPPAAARTYAYVTVAMYESAVPGMTGHRSMVGQLRGLPELPAPKNGRVDWPTVVSAAARTAAGRVLVDPADATIAALDAAHEDVLRSRRAAGTPEPHIRLATEHGVAIGNAIGNWADQDGYAGTLGRSYSPRDGDAYWKPTPPRFGRAIEPYWGEVDTMVLTRGDEVVPVAPIPFSSEPGSAFRRQAEAVIETARTRTVEQEDIARFWTDNPGPNGQFTGLPSGHWHLITSHLASVKALPLSKRLEAHARTGVALHDAFTNCWVWKYRYDLVRPVTYIQKFIDPTFATYVNTPQFPEYTSGHSVASAAAATVLTDLFGTVAFTDDSHAVRGHAARHFTSIWAAADEAASSRIYGGIHYPMGIEHGLTQGTAVGRLVLDRLRTRA